MLTSALRKLIKNFKCKFYLESCVFNTLKCNFFNLEQIFLGHLSAIPYLVLLHSTKE